MPPATRSQTAVRNAVANSGAPATLAALNAAAEMNTAAGEASRTSTQPGTSTQNRDTDVQSTTSSTRRRRARVDEPDEPPRFTIDLSLPPEQRYLALCAAFKDEIAELVPLFDEVVGGMLHFLPLKWLHRFCRLSLRGVYDDEEDAELQGISKATGVSMYLLVCFNVLLDLFMGCSSGGAAVRDGDGGSKMLHFRTLDWGMPSLRRVVVQLDFVLQKDGSVFASSITYAGYVGVLTGVREGLSMSLNFRPNRIDNGIFWSDAKYIWHLASVLLGRRRSISSTLRGFLLPRSQKAGWLTKTFTMRSSEELPGYEGIVKDMGGDEATGKRPITTTACYFCVCSGKATTVIEKDRVSAKSRSADEFIIVTNTDESPPSSPSPGNNTPAEEKVPSAAAGQDNMKTTKANELAEIVGEAKDRQECAFHNWRNLQSSKAREQRLSHISGDDRKRLASVEDVVQLVQKYPTTNECTHFAAVMDPKLGRATWCRRWKEPVGARWIREHMSGTW